jgi:hypothetical protein
MWRTQNRTTASLVFTTSPLSVLEVFYFLIAKNVVQVDHAFFGSLNRMAAYNGPHLPLALRQVRFLPVLVLESLQKIGRSALRKSTFQIK